MEEAGARGVRHTRGSLSLTGKGGGVSEPVTQKELPRPREMSAGKQRGLCLDCRQAGSRPLTASRYVEQGRMASC